MPVILGTDTDDTIAATSDLDQIFGLEGNDTLSSSFSRADLQGGLGNDLVEAAYTYDVAAAGPYPPLKWILFGGQDNDIVRADAAITISAGAPFINPDPVETDILVRGGRGDDMISVSNTIEIQPGVSSFTRVAATTTIFDYFGNNKIAIDTVATTTDSSAMVAVRVDTGSGNDDVTIDSRGDAFNFTSRATHQIGLGDGNNRLALTERTGELTIDMASGAGADVISVNVELDSANSSSALADMAFDLGARADTFELSLSGGIDFTTISLDVDLGRGNNNAVIDIQNVNSRFDGTEDIRITALGGNDTIGVTLRSGEFGRSTVMINAGNGNNKIDLDLGLSGERGLGGRERAEATVVTGNGDDVISIAGAPVSVGVHAGAGADAIVIDGAGNSIDRRGGPALQIELKDISFASNDVLLLKNFGEGWADTTGFGPNGPTYDAAADTWEIDSRADLRDLVAAGVVTATGLANGSGTRLTFMDAEGDLIRVDLFGITF